MLAVGLFVAYRLVAQTRKPELFVVLPPACALLGGPFVHSTQMFVAIPAFLVLMRCFERHRSLHTAALLLVAIPWLALADNSLGPAVIAVLAVATVVSLPNIRTCLPQMLFTISTMVVIAFAEHHIRVAFPPTHLNLEPELAREAAGSLPADATWAIWVRGEVSDQWYIASHLPTWIGLIILVVSSISLSKGPSLSPPNASARSAPSTTAVPNRA